MAEAEVVEGDLGKKDVFNEFVFMSDKVRRPTLWRSGVRTTTARGRRCETGKGTLVRIDH